MTLNRNYMDRVLYIVFAISWLFSSGCTVMSDGPSRLEIQKKATVSPHHIQFVNVTMGITRQLAASVKESLFSSVFKTKNATYCVGPGDVLELSIWEIPPATLFPNSGLAGAAATSQISQLPPQMISSEGTIDVPFLGKVHVAGLNLQKIQNKIASQLQGKAHDPQILVRLLKNATSNVTVVGEVNDSLRLPLTPARERLLDALAAAHGVKAPVNKTTVQLARGNKTYFLPLVTIIRDPKQNVILEPRDIITVFYQPKSFTVLGATGKSEEINFEGQGISLSQALGRAGGLLDYRADARGIFIFRFERASTYKWLHTPPYITQGNKIPVIYRVDLKTPEGFFIAQDFPIQDHDIIYVSTASLAQFQKVVNVVAAASFPLVYLAAFHNN